MSKPWTINIDVRGPEDSPGGKQVTFRSPHRPTEEELGAQLQSFFSTMNFRLSITEIHDDVLICPPPNNARETL